MRLREFHEWPLVVLTSCAIPAAGIFVARLFARLVSGAGQPGAGPETLATLALLLGLLASLAHLGRPARAPLALRRTGRSMLSTEVVLASALLAVAAVGLLPSIPNAVRGAFVIAAGLLGLGLLLVLGLVYFLPARWPWRTSLVAAPITLGVATGVIALACTSVAPFPPLVPLAALAVDTAVFASVWIDLPHPPGYAPAHPYIAAHWRSLVSVRVLLMDLAPASFLLAQRPAIALVSALCGLVVDRFAFYGLAATRSTEAEMARVDANIGSR